MTKTIKNFSHKEACKKQCIVLSSLIYSLSMAKHNVLGVLPFVSMMTELSQQMELCNLSVGNNKGGSVKERGGGAMIVVHVQLYNHKYCMFSYNVIPR